MIYGILLALWLGPALCLMGAGYWFVKGLNKFASWLKKRKSNLKRGAMKIDIFDERRKELGMSYAALARRAKVASITVERAMHGDDADRMHPEKLTAIAEALGLAVELRITPKCEAAQFLQDQAEEKVREALECVVDSATFEKMVAELLEGPRRRLWG